MGRLKSDRFALTISNEGKTGIFPSAYLIIHFVLIFKDQTRGVGKCYRSARWKTFPSHFHSEF